jgi:hypothetical protein
LREVLGVAEGSLASRDDRNLEQRVRVLEVPATDGVTGFVVGYRLLLFGPEY